jgi:hypothetical protein
MAALWLLFACSACGAAPQPESAETVSAFEVPLPTERDRSEFLTIVGDAAEAEGHHLDAASSEELRDSANAIPQAKMTIHAAVWRGSMMMSLWRRSWIRRITSARCGSCFPRVKIQH